jgi:hypothetical protein
LAYAQNSDVSLEPLWLLILPGTISDYEDQDRENKIADMVADIAWETGRFEIFDRHDVEDLILKYIPITYSLLHDSILLKIGETIQCDEALIIDLMRFSQIGVPPVEDEGDESGIIEDIFNGIFSGDSEDYSDNILTRLTVRFRNINLIDGKEIDRFEIKISHTGGTKLESEEQALKNFNEAVFNEVRMIYQLVSEVISVDGLDLNLTLGTDLGLTGNTIFEIKQPNQIKTVSGEKVTFPGKPLALACLQSVGDTINHARVIRQWDVIEPGYYASEYNKNIHGLQIFFSPKFPEDYLYIGGQFHYSPLGPWDFGGGIYYTAITDSYNELNNGLGFGLFGAGRVLSLTALMVHAKIGLNFDIPFKEDDSGTTVTTGVFSGTLGLSASLMLTETSDIELNIGYRQSAKSSSWSYSENEEEFEAIWENDPPAVDLSGFYFTIGYKFIFF